MGIFGALWRIKAIFESGRADTNLAHPVSKEIRIFSDMMDETKEFPMPDLIELGPKQVSEHARANGLIVPLKGYRIYVYGASTSGLKPQNWMTVKSSGLSTSQLQSPRLLLTLKSAKLNDSPSFTSHDHL